MSTVEFGSFSFLRLVGSNLLALTSEPRWADLRLSMSEELINVPDGVEHDPAGLGWHCDLSRGRTRFDTVPSTESELRIRVDFLSAVKLSRMYYGTDPEQSGKIRADLTQQGMIEVTGERPADFGEFTTALHDRMVPLAHSQRWP
jgi:hypothetical protein